MVGIASRGEVTPSSDAELEALARAYERLRGSDGRDRARAGQFGGVIRIRAGGDPQPVWAEDDRVLIAILASVRDAEDGQGTLEVRIAAIEYIGRGYLTGLVANSGLRTISVGPDWLVYVSP